MSLVEQFLWSWGAFRSHLVAAVSEGLAGQVGGQTVKDQISTGGAGGHVAVVSIEGHAGHLLFVVLRAEIQFLLKRRSETFMRSSWSHDTPVMMSHLANGVIPWGSGAASWSSDPRCERTGPDLRSPGTERRSSDTHWFVSSEQRQRDDRSYYDIIWLL